MACPNYDIFRLLTPEEAAELYDAQEDAEPLPGHVIEDMVRYATDPVFRRQQQRRWRRQRRRQNAPAA